MNALQISVTAACIKHNFAAFDEQLDEILEKYQGLVVTEDSVKDARAQATELNKLKQNIADRRKEVVGQASEPIKAFDAEAKRLEKKVDDTRTDITAQLKRMEEERLQQVESKLVNEVERVYADEHVDDEFRTADISDLVKLGSITAKGALTAAAKKAVRAKVIECLNLQQKVEFRLNMLAQHSQIAGLVSPLGREHVEAFLKTPDDKEFEDRVNAILEKELARQEAVEQRARTAAEEELRSAAENAVLVPGNPAAPPPAPPSGDELPDIPDLPDIPGEEPMKAPGKNRVGILVELSVVVPDNVGREAIISQLRTRLASAGVEKSVHSIKITGVQAE